jgi:hypothetical protein
MSKLNSDKSTRSRRRSKDAIDLICVNVVRPKKNEEYGLRHEEFPCANTSPPRWPRCCWGWDSRRRSRRWPRRPRFRSSSASASHRRRCPSTTSLPFPATATYGHPDTGPGTTISATTTGCPAPGSDRPGTAISGPRPTGAGAEAGTSSTTVTGARASATTAASTTAMATTVTDTMAAIGAGTSFTTTGRSTISHGPASTRFMIARSPATRTTG